MAVSPYEVYRVLEEKLGKEDAQKVGKAIEEALNTIEKKALEQKPILKAELKEELTKELATKADVAEMKAELTQVRAELSMAKAELVLELEKIKLEFKFIKVMLFILAGLVLFFNRDSISLLLEVFRLFLR